MEEIKSQVCAPGCSCGKPSGNKKLKAVICLIVLLAVCGILVYKAKGAKQITSTVTETGFAAPLANEAVPPAVDKQEPAVKPAAVESNKRIGGFLDSLGSLNKVAADQDVVFVFVPAKGSDTADKKTVDAIMSAEQKLKSNGVRIGLYTLQPGSPDHTDLAAQLNSQGMLVMSKGRGMGSVSGEITETKILQAYVTSSRAGGCGPSSSCGPSTKGCGPSAPALGPRRQ